MTHNRKSFISGFLVSLTLSSILIILIIIKKPDFFISTPLDDKSGVAGMGVALPDASARTQDFVPTNPALHPAAKDTSSTQTILQDFANAWRGVEEMKLGKPFVIAFWIEGKSGGEFSITLSDTGGKLSPGLPDKYDWGFRTDKDTLKKLYNGQWNALTAMAQARASDPIPLVPVPPPDFNDSKRMRSFYIPLMLHFWNRDWPERIAFGEGVTRRVHGADAAVLVYTAGLRSAWYQVNPDTHINADPKDQINDFDTAIIIFKGKFMGRLGGEELVLQEGETVLIPKGMTHEFWAKPGQYGEFIILMYGDGA